MRLENLIDIYISDIADGIAYILISKINNKWNVKSIWNESAELEEFEEFKNTIRQDPNAMIINGYDNVWVGTDGVGGYTSVKDVTKRIRNAYNNKFCPSTIEDIESLIPEELKAQIQNTEDIGNQSAENKIRLTGDYTLFIGNEETGRKTNFIEWEEQNSGSDRTGIVRTYYIKYASNRFPDEYEYYGMIWEFILKNNITGEKIKYRIGETPQKIY